MMMIKYFIVAFLTFALSVNIAADDWRSDQLIRDVAANFVNSGDIVLVKEQNHPSPVEGFFNKSPALQSEQAEADFESVSPGQVLLSCIRRNIDHLLFGLFVGHGRKVRAVPKYQTPIARRTNPFQQLERGGHLLEEGWYEELSETGKSHVGTRCNVTNIFARPKTLQLSPPEAMSGFEMLAIPIIILLDIAFVVMRVSHECHCESCKGTSNTNLKAKSDPATAAPTVTAAVAAVASEEKGDGISEPKSNTKGHNEAATSPQDDDEDIRALATLHHGARRLLGTTLRVGLAGTALPDYLGNIERVHLWIPEGFDPTHRVLFLSLKQMKGQNQDNAELSPSELKRDRRAARVQFTFGDSRGFTCEGCAALTGRTVKGRTAATTWVAQARTAATEWVAQARTAAAEWVAQGRMAAADCLSVVLQVPWLPFYNIIKPLCGIRTF